MQLLHGKLGSGPPLVHLCWNECVAKPVHRRGAGEEMPARVHQAAWRHSFIIFNERARLGVLPPHGVIYAQERRGLIGQLEITMETMATPESGC